MGRPSKPRRSIACSFSLPPELRPQLEYVQMAFGLSAWIQGMLSNLKIDSVLAEQYGIIKEIIEKNNLYVRRLGIDDKNATRYQYDFVVSGLGEKKDRDIAVDVQQNKEVEGNARAGYEAVSRTLQELTNQGFTARWF